MVWAMDQVDQKGNNGFGGSAAAGAGANVTPDQQADANQKSLDTLAGLKCYVSACNAKCKAGTNKVAEFNGQPSSLSTNNRCSKGAYRSLCCDSKTKTGTCQWRGYRGAGLACIKGCAAGETELTTNTNQHDDKKGNKNCHGGLQSSCCSNFKPASSSLEDDLKDAAKAFCRVAVPALLAPLELLEDLIPIVGEIADLVEIAATPAIIQGCIKGIEKEGKAEFKVFGKSHTLSLDKPKTKPTSVPDRPPPKNDNPSKPGDKNDRCDSKSNQKRAREIEDRIVQSAQNGLPHRQKQTTTRLPMEERRRLRTPHHVPTPLHLRSDPHPLRHGSRLRTNHQTATCKKETITTPCGGNNDNNDIKRFPHRDPRLDLRRLRVDCNQQQHHGRRRSLQPRPG